MPHRASLAPNAAAEIEARISRSLYWIETSTNKVIALPSDYPDGYHTARHTHSRGQLLHALQGAVLVRTDAARFMVPPGHALWLPAGVPHEVDMIGKVAMRSIYVARNAIPGLPETVKVFGLTDLMRALIISAGQLPRDGTSARADLIMNLLLEEIPNLPERPLALPLPEDQRIALLCRRFLAAPSATAHIDDWAQRLAMSRRAFTRAFRRETGLSLSTWRQQACLFAALPRLAGGEPVTSVALDLGYESVAAFTTMFKRMLGAPPKLYFRAARSA